MSTSIKTPFAHASRKLISSLQSWSLRPSNVNSKQKPNRYSIPHFDADNERLFRQELKIETLSTLKTVLLLGASCFLGFIVLGIVHGGLSKDEIIGYLLIVITLTVLFVILYRHPQPESQVNSVAKLSAVLSVIGLSCILLTENNPALYAEIWIGLLPIYFFIYGQMFMTITEALKFGLLAMIIMPLSGYLIGVETAALMPSIIILLIVNAFGFCTRCQLEAHTRNLFRERRQAECISADKTLFLRQLSHNLRQPLQALSCYSSVLDAGFTNHSAPHLHNVAVKLGAAVDDLNNAFNHILDIANLETGRQIPQLAAIDVNILLATLADRFAQQAAKKDLKLKIHLRSQPPYTVYSDACILSQIISNLIDNAIKYTDSGWIVIAAVKTRDNRLMLHIRDSGIGIADELHDDIFKEFFRCPKHQTDAKTNGLGIGLAYVLKAMEYLPDHSLQVHSRLHQGSDFQLCLPVVDTAQQQLCAQPLHSGFTDSFVFIVDTDQQVLQAMAEQLSAWGCLVQTAACKAETLAALAENFRAPDLLITDFYLNDNETAHDIIAAVQADCGPVPTLILSCHNIPAEDRAKLPESTLLLRKPAGGEVLMGMMAKAMGTWSSARPFSVEDTYRNVDKQSNAGAAAEKLGMKGIKKFSYLGCENSTQTPSQI